MTVAAATTTSPMDVLFIALGSHGDVHPFVGLARAMQARGHRARVAANEIFGPMIEKAGVGFIQCGDRETFTTLQANPDLWNAQKGPATVLGAIGKSIREVYEVVATNAGPDTFLVGSSLALGGLCASEKLGIPMATVHLAPICIRSCATMPVLPGAIDLNFLPMWARRMFWTIADRLVIAPMINPMLNTFRAELGLPAVRNVQKEFWNARLLTIGLWPEWFFPRQSDYPEQVQLAGFPLYDESDHQSLDADLEAWLAAGDKPIAFTPGSAMVFGHRFFETAVEACQRLGKRGLLLTRHPEQIPKNLPSTVRHVPFAPFGLLLPRCAAVVHHGGIGTTAQGLRAGIPQLMMAMSHDQPDNASICRELGVADWTSPRRFTPRRVSRKLSRLLRSTDVAAACKRIADLAERDHGAQRACELIERANAAPRVRSTIVHSVVTSA
jgi:UDP:flavonoid glycosyltransferase YjiC (YdhE family)